MTTMNIEVYNALKSINIDDVSAQKAAESVASSHEDARKVARAHINEFRSEFRHDFQNFQDAIGEKIDVIEDKTNAVNAKINYMAGALSVLTMLTIGIMIKLFTG